jgi:O-antigen ligase
VIVALGLVAVYVVLMTFAAPPAVLLAWTGVAAALAVVSLAGGLTILAAIGPFTEALTDDGRITAVPFLLAALGLGVLLAGARVVVRHSLPRPPTAVMLAGALFSLTLVGVGLSALSFGIDRGIEALQLWVPGVGGGLTVLFAAWLVARQGEHRPLVVLIVSITLAALLSLADVLLEGALRSGALAWLLRSTVGPERLTGVIPAPNAAAAIFLVGLAGCGAFVQFGHRRPHLRLLAAMAAMILLGAIVLTYSRSALLALPVMAAVVAWRWRGWPALAVVVAAGVGAVTVALAFPQLGLSREVPFWADEARLAAWAATGGMWLDQPLLGHGFRSFEWLHEAYGSTLDAPHNEWLRFVAEGGSITGLLAVGLVVAALTRLVGRRSWVAVAGAAALSAVAVMASFNNPLLYVQVTSATFLTIGIGIGATESVSAGSQGPATHLRNLEKPYRD